MSGGVKSSMAREDQLKEVSKRITVCEKQLAQLCEDFAGYTRKTARLRDKGDTLAREVFEGASIEGKTGKAALQQAAQLLSLVQDCRQTQVQRLETKVIKPLKDYKEHCRGARSDVKQATDAHKRVNAQQKKVEGLVSGNKERDIATVSRAHGDLSETKAKAEQLSKGLEDTTHSFEERRVGDMKSIVRDFVHIEMLFHAKALELYTQMYRAVDTFDTEQDLEEFRQSIRAAEPLTAVSSAATPSSTAVQNQNKQSSNQNGAEEESEEEEGESEEEESEEDVPDEVDGQEEGESEDGENDDEEEEDDDDEDFDETETEPVAPPRKG